MLDKIRLYAQGKLPDAYHGNLGKGFDGRCARFLRVEYPKLREKVLQGGTDQENLSWCFAEGRKPNDEEIQVWNGFMIKRGWRDEVSKELEESKRSYGLEHRDDILTYFDLIVADEEGGG